MKYEPKLDGMRAYAAIAVIGMHWKELFPFGWVGVQFFFVLSGFLITSILSSSRERSGSTLKTYATTFFQRRALRLLPLYYSFCLLLIVSWLFFNRSSPLGATLPYILTYTLNLARMMPHYETGHIYTHLWTLAVEWQFYLIWPFVIWALSRQRLKQVAWILLLVAPICRLLCYYFAGKLAGDTTTSTPEIYSAYFVYNSPLSHIDAFGFGALLSYGDVTAKLRLPKVKLFALTLFVLGGLFVIQLGRSSGYSGIRSLGYPACMPYFYQWLWGYSIINFCSVCLIAWCLETGKVQSLILGNRPIVYLGTISYGIYIWHYPIVRGLVGLFGESEPIFSLKSMVGLIAATIATIAVAAFSYRYLEKPFLKFKNSKAVTVQTVAPRPVPFTQGL